ncbi:MAG: helix-turn-helix domain-containing protein [Bryobacteraceae bacterium]
MEEPGQRLRQVRERLNLRYRDVEDASLRIAERLQNPEFGIALSRLADIENKGTLPTLYRLYSLCAIYRLDLFEVLRWYGIDFTGLPADALSVGVERTHLIGFRPVDHAQIELPFGLDPGVELGRTTYLSRMIQRWGKLPLALLNGLDLKRHRYGFIGMDDWFMFPLLHPGSLVLVDESRTRIATGGWASEFERPIYFVEHRSGYACAWCHITENRLVLQPHPASQCVPEVHNYPNDVDIVGQVVGVAMRLDPGRRRRTRP